MLLCCYGTCSIIHCVNYVTEIPCDLILSSGGQHYKMDTKGRHCIAGCKCLIAVISEIAPIAFQKFHNYRRFGINLHWWNIKKVAWWAKPMVWRALVPAQPWQDTHMSMDPWVKPLTPSSLGFTRWLILCCDSQACSHHMCLCIS